MSFYRNNSSQMLVLFLCFFMLSFTLCACIPEQPKVSSDTLNVEKVENLSDGFIMGMDASSIPALEESGVRFFDFNGAEKDVFEIFADNGINYIRVRVWNDPYDSDGNGYGGGNCDIEKAIQIGLRASKYGMKLLVDFHYSDFWADPGKQSTPKKWSGYDVDQKANAIYEYTKEGLEKLRDAGVDVGMVQIGNETNAFMCGETGWPSIARLMNAGSRAVREVCPDTLVVLHFTNPENVTRYNNYAYNLFALNVDYDVFASSYYPYWHGTLENLSLRLEEIAETYGKKVMVAETSYCYTSDNTDMHPNTISGASSEPHRYPYTPQGQANLVRDVIDTVANISGGIGVFYWEGAWISVPGETWAQQHSLWEEHGSGWAASYAGSYDPDDAGKWYGGCAVDNQAFFDADGKVLESLKVFALVKEGNIIEQYQDNKP